MKPNIVLPLIPVNFETHYAYLYHVLWQGQGIVILDNTIGGDFYNFSLKKQMSPSLKTQVFTREKYPLSLFLSSIYTKQKYD